MRKKEKNRMAYLLPNDLNIKRQIKRGPGAIGCAVLQRVASPLQPQTQAQASAIASF